MTILSRVIIALSIGLSLAFALVAGDRLLQPAQPRPATAVATTPLLDEVLERIRREYVDPVDDIALMEAAVRGVVADLDPHSEFLDAQTFEHVRDGADGAYSGIGIEVSLRDGAVTVVAPFADSPAERAGMLAGDVILSVDDFPVRADALQDTVARMRGPAGTPVTLAVLRGDDPDPLRLTLLRAELAVQSVRAELVAPGVGLCSIRQFHGGTPDELAAAVASLERSAGRALHGLVLDLRNNPGGLLDAAIEVSDLFLDGGVIVSAHGRGDGAEFAYHARPGSVLPNATMVVLVNGASASAAEIVAAALQDHGRARLVGTSTFGKGVVQTVMPLAQGGAIKLTTSRYYTPNGDYIHDRGITPDVVVRNTGETDRQLARAVRMLRTDSASL